ncbi:MAG: EAL domain-containing protein, partial [Proteobacteria bacterium]|nr:EAL domain-containing protein [Pseudomonadota bacterium]
SEAQAKADAEIQAAKEAREKLETELKAIELAKAEAEAMAKADAEAKAKAEAEIQAAKEAREKLEAELKAIELAKAEAEAKAKADAEIRAEQEAKIKLEAELKAAEEAKAKVEAEIRAEQEAKQRLEAELKAEAEARAKIEAEAELKAAKEAKERLEAELKAAAEAKATAEAEIKAAKEAKERLEAELKAASDKKEKTKSEQVQEENVEEQTAKTEVTKEKVSKPEAEAKTETESSVEPSVKKEDISEESKDAEENITDNNLSIAEAELQIKKLFDEKRVLQTYQPVISMSDTNEFEEKEVYKTGLQTITDDEQITDFLKDTSVFSISMQQIINEWVLRQIFLRITESGTANCKYLFIITVTESWFVDISFFNWLQKILTQTKKYSPGKSILLEIPLDTFKKHEKRAQAVIDTLNNSHHFNIALSNIESIENIYESCLATSSRLLLLTIEQLKKLGEILSPQQNESSEEEEEEESEKKNLLQYLKQNEIHIITTGIEDSTLLTDAITAGTDYVIGNFVGEIQDNLAETNVESFELT